jgi:type II secretory pathway pseudopilin PulG
MINKRNRAQLNFNGASRSENRSGVGLLEIFLTIAILVILAALFLPMMGRRNVRPAMERAQCKNNLKQIGLALHNYEEAHGALPPAYTVDANGQPLHSWRTLILPYLDEKPLYESIDLSKPWNDPANADAFAKTVHVFTCPSADTPAQHTTYHALVGENCCLHPTRPRKLNELTDETSHTLAVVDVSSAEAVHWMSPKDTAHRFLLGFSENSDLAHDGGIQAVFADGKVQYLPTDLPKETRRALATIAGGENVNLDF